MNDVTIDVIISERLFTFLKTFSVIGVAAVSVAIIYAINLFCFPEKNDE